MTFHVRHLRSALLATLTAAAITGATVAQAADEPANVIKYRGAVMKALGGHIGAIASVVKGEVSYSGHVAAHAQALHATGLMLGEVFPEGSDQGETRAKPEIWKDWAKFEGIIKSFNAETEKLAQVAESGDMAAIGAQLGKVGEGCGSCHKPFRKEKE